MFWRFLSIAFQYHFKTSSHSSTTVGVLLKTVRTNSHLIAVLAAFLVQKLLILQYTPIF
jgi:hypothetical protein